MLLQSYRHRIYLPGLKLYEEKVNELSGRYFWINSSDLRQLPKIENLFISSVSKEAWKFLNELLKDAKNGNWKYVHITGWNKELGENGNIGEIYGKMGMHLHVLSILPKITSRYCFNGIWHQ